MWISLALFSALCQVLRNTVMKRLGHSLDEYINVWGRFTFLLPFALIFALATGWPAIQPGFAWICLGFGLCQNVATLALSKALKLAEISLVTALWKVSLPVLLVMGYLTLRETPTVLGVAGVLISAAGVYYVSARPAEERDRAIQEIHRRKLVPFMLQCGYPEQIARPLALGFAYHPAVAITFRVEEIYLQTPGPEAGNRML